MKVNVRQSLRLFLKNRLHFIVNFLGLAVSMVSCLVIFNYVVYEFSYDKFNDKKDNIFRATLKYYKDGKLSFHSAQTYPAVGPQMKVDLPEVEEYARLRSVWAVVSYKDAAGSRFEFMEERIFYADASVFKIFSLKTLSGDPIHQLDKPNTAVISSTMAQKYFGKSDPIGKVINLKFSSDFEPYTVAGVFEDVPSNSHLQFDFLLSYKSFVHYTGPVAEKSWTWFGFFTYVLLKPGTDSEKTQAKLPGFIKTHADDPPGSRSELVLQPLKDIHLKSDLTDEAAANGSSQNVYFLMLLGLLIVVVAWINYINMTLALTLYRTREIGVRRTLGASAPQIYFLFIRESVIVNMGVFLFSIVAMAVSCPLLARIFDKPFSFIFPDTYLFILVLGLFFFLGAIVSGIYPAYTILSRHLLDSIRGKFISSKSIFTSGRILVLGQYIISLFFVACTIGIFFQLRLMKTNDKGFNAEEVLCIKAPSVNEGNYLYSSDLQSFKDELLRIPEVEAVSASDNIPGKENENVIGPIRKLGAPESQGDAYRTVGIDMDYLSLYRINVVAGRAFSRNFGADDSTVMLNQSAARALGFANATDAVGQQLVGLNNRTVDIIGIVNDFYQLNEKHRIDPLIFYIKPGKDVLDHRYISIRTNKHIAAGLTGKIAGIWNQSFPGNPFIYFFAKDFYNQQYKEERQFSQVFTVFSIISILIALMGLFGLLSLVTIQKKKDIAIHRILGASSARISWLLSRVFVVSIVIALIIGMLLATWAINDWLNSYNVRIRLGFIFYLVPSIIILLLTGCIVSYQVFRLNITRPAEALKFD